MSCPRSSFCSDKVDVDGLVSFSACRKSYKLTNWEYSEGGRGAGAAVVAVFVVEVVGVGKWSGERGVINQSAMAGHSSL